MIELPEAVNLSRQLACVIDKEITNVVAAQNPHKFAWYTGEPADYPAKLKNRRILCVEQVGGSVKLNLEGYVLVFSEGINLRFFEAGEKIPPKHQLLLTFADSTHLFASIQMYGGILCAPEAEIENPYYLAAREKPSPLGGDFNDGYFKFMFEAEEVRKLSVKAFLATEQRIPGLGNGVLQDILLAAGVHHKKKINSFTREQQEQLFKSIKTVLREMTEQGGRDTEKNLSGNPGGYKTRLSRNTLGTTCSRCGQGTVRKAAYMGGSIYFCDSCQEL